jgi:hypothetical protein
MSLLSRNWFGIYGLCLLFFPLFAQSQDKRVQDVVYLKNHWILKGEIILNNQDSLKVRTSGGNIFAFTRSEVLDLKKEKIPSYYQNKTSGFSSYTELGPLASKNTSTINVNTSAFSFQTVNGYTFTPLFFTGIGIGVDLYATQTFLPLFGSIRGEFNTQGPINPYYFLDLGHGFNITTNPSNTLSNKGGLLLALGGGIKINFNRASGFLLSLGYRIQNLSTTDLSLQKTTLSQYSRIALRAGFYF